MFREWLLLLRHVDLKIYYAVLTGVHAQDDTAHAFEVLLELIQFERDVTVVVAVSSAGVGSGVVTQFEVEVSLFLVVGVDLREVVAHEQEFMLREVRSVESDSHVELVGVHAAAEIAGLRVG